MMYLFFLSSHNTTFYAILKDISIINGTVYGTQIGVPDGFDANGKLVFTACEPSKYIAGGSAFTLVEYKDELKKKS